MDENQMPLTAKQYNELYCKAFARLDEISHMAERAMKELEELEELQLSMGDRAAEGAVRPGGLPEGALRSFPRRQRTKGT